MNIYDFNVKDTAGNDVAMSDYRGKVLLIVNTATGCGFTPQYEALEALYKKYREQGFEVLDFPCNQFLNQAPGTNEEIVEFCQLKYATTFQTFGKIAVNGKEAEPLYDYLKQAAKDDVEDEQTSGLMKTLRKLGQSVMGADIKWNFTKFLVDREGKVVGRFSPTVKPEALDGRIAQLLAQENA